MFSSLSNGVFLILLAMHLPTRLLINLFLPCQFSCSWQSPGHHMSSLNSCSWQRPIAFSVVVLLFLTGACCSSLSSLACAPVPDRCLLLLSPPWLLFLTVACCCSSILPGLCSCSWQVPAAAPLSSLACAPVPDRCLLLLFLTGACCSCSRQILAAH